MTFHPSRANIIFAIDDFSVFRSTDAGVTWTRLPIAVNAIALRFANGDPASLYLGTDRALYRSSNLGNSWRWVSDFPTLAWLSDLEIHPRNSQILYTIHCCGGGLLRSTNSGATWEARSTGLPSNYVTSQLEVDPTNGDVLIAATNGLIFGSSNAGQSWIQMADLNGFVMNLIIDPLDSHTVYAANGCVMRSMNSGHTWKALNCAQLNAIAVGPDRPRALFAAGSEALRSTSNGKNWERLNPPPRYLEYMSVFVHPLQREMVFLGSINNGLFRSTDAGENWRVVSRGLNSQDIWHVVSAGPGKLYATGENWQFQVLSPDHSHWFIPPKMAKWRIEQIAVHPRNQDLVVLEGSFSNESDRNIAVSTNGGETWQFRRALSGIVVYQTQVLTFDSEDENTLLIAPGGNNGQSAGVARSTDLGRTWKLSNDGLANLSVSRILTVNSNVFVVTEEPPQIYKSVNRGQTWQLISNPLALQSLFPVDLAASGQTLYVIAQDASLQSYLYVTRDGGITWNRQYSWAGKLKLPLNILRMDPANPRHLYACSTWGRTLFQSVDEGNHWQSIPHPPLVMFELLADPYQPGRLHIGTDRGVYSGNN